MKCRVTIDNGKDGGKYVSSGELNIGRDGFGLFYSIDGDKCLLTYAGGTLVQERRGSVPLVMKFTQGKETTCILGGGSGSGTFPVYTDKIEISRGDRLLTVKLNYTCAGENVTLDITAQG